MWRIGLVLLLVGCTEVITAAPYEFSVIHQGDLRIAGKMAAEHCAFHDKIPVLVGLSGNTFHFQCIEGPVNTRP